MTPTVRAHASFLATCSVLAATFATACSGADDAPATGSADGDGATAAERFVVRTYERSFVFVAAEDDSTLIVPWMVRTVAERDSVMREARAWLGRGDDWEGFYAERWWSPPTREPARLLPRGGLTILVRDGNAVDGLLFEEGPRRLELLLGDVDESWADARGGSFDVRSGSTRLFDEEVDGLVLEMARVTNEEEAPAGDWAFLVSGDSAAFVLAADIEHGRETEPAYRGWGAFEAADLQWPEVGLTWTRTQAFPPARRDVPVEWSVAGNGLEGALGAISAEMQAGDGPGPLLPVRALFAVEGWLDTARGRFPVRGLLTHERH